MTEPPGRYHLRLILDGKATLDGWWNDADTAERKMAGLCAEHEERDGVQLLLTEWDDGQEWPLDAWPPTPVEPADAGQPA